MVLAPTLTLSAGSGAAIVRPTFSRDFAGEKTLNNGTGPAIAFTRASNATYFDASGTLQTASSDTPRFDHDPATAGNPSRGLLIEEARTNSLRNSQAGGSTNGLVWSPSAFVGTGVIATHWGSFRAFGSLEVVGQGTEQGFNYIDVKFSGNNSNAFALSQIVSGDGFTTIDATSGETWTASVYVKLAGGSLSGVSAVSLAAQGRNTGNTVLTENTTTTVTPNSSYQRVVATRAMSDPATAKVSLDVVVTASATSTIDLTLRIAAPQLEQGAFATSYIPTTSVAVERLADSAIVNPISSFYNASEGTLFAEFSRYSIAGTGSIFVADNETIGNRVGLFGTVAQVAISDVYTTIDTFSVVAGTVYRGILGYKANDHAATLNGAAVDTNTAVGVPVAATHLRIGSEAFAGAEIAGHIRRIAYFPKRLSNALLQSLTT
jgi:hypothetical protein